MIQIPPMLYIATIAIILACNGMVGISVSILIGCAILAIIARLTD